LQRSSIARALLHVRSFREGLSEKGDTGLKRILTLATAAMFLSVAAATAKAADLTVTVNDVRNTKGSVMIAVYDERNFGRIELAKINRNGRTNR
jgi:uncharacterized protein (DUF2141 family)